MTDRGKKHGPRREPKGTAAMNGRGKSDGVVVPTKSANEGAARAALEEPMEGRTPTKGNSNQQNRQRTLSRERLEDALSRVREAATKDKETRFTALWHHVYDVDRLREAYFALARKASPGLDGETWQTYGVSLEENLADLSDRLRRGGYRPQPVLRVMIPKTDGKQRPIGVPVVEDKIVQRATAEVLNAIYETEFRPFSYGFRAGRSQHDALDALELGITKRKVSWILDADIQGFFDAIDHHRLIEFLERRIADERVHRHVKKWLHAGVFENGTLRAAEEGTPQGGSISPLLANIYLHYVLDVWVSEWRRTQAHGDVIIVRYADDFIVGFQHQVEAEAFLRALHERLGANGLKLHPEKTRLIEFGRFARERRARQGLAKPETFDFLGFTHICGRSPEGWFRLVRKTRRKRMQAKLKELDEELRRRMHQHTHVIGQYLRRVVAGHNRYYGVPGNRDALSAFRYYVTRLWQRTLARRSQKARKGLWARITVLADRWLPRPEIHHQRPVMPTSTQGRSPVR